MTDNLEEVRARIISEYNVNRLKGECSNHWREGEQRKNLVS